MSRIQETTELLEKLEKEGLLISQSSRDADDKRNDKLEDIYKVLSDIALSLAVIADNSKKI